MSTVHSLTFTGEWIRTLRQPLVYVWRRGDVVLYVGVGTKGISRPLGEHHRLVPSEIQDGDRLDVYLFDDPVQAVAAEQEMIDSLRPTLNQAKVSSRYQSAWEINLRNDNDSLRFENEILRYKAETLESTMRVIAQRHGPSVVSRVASAALARLKPEWVKRQLRRRHSEFVA